MFCACDEGTIVYLNGLPSVHGTVKGRSYATSSRGNFRRARTRTAYGNIDMQDFGVLCGTLRLGLASLSRHQGIGPYEAIRRM
jgi:hypothetical protein